MTRSLNSRRDSGVGNHGSRCRTAVLAALSLYFLVLAFAGSRGRADPSRRAELEEIRLCRHQLQEALDARRAEAAGPSPARSAAVARSSERAVREWLSKLKSRLTEFGSAHTPASELEELNLRLSEATLAIAERRFADALRVVGARAETLETASTGVRRAALLRVRADAHYDQKDWSVALEHYRQVVLLEPGRLSALERVAECLYSLQQADRALQTYADLATRLHDRGKRLLAEFDHRGGVRDLNKAATIRLWLLQQGRRELAAELAQSFSSCGNALFATRRLDLAKVYLTHAIDVRTQLVSAGVRGDLADELASDHATLARVLLKLGKPTEALSQFDAAIGLTSRLVDRGQLEFRGKLATRFAHRGLVRRVEARISTAVEDFEKAAETFARMEDFEQAVSWQEKAVDLAADDKRSEAARRLDDYRSHRAGS